MDRGLPVTDRQSVHDVPPLEPLKTSAERYTFPYVYQEAAMQVAKWGNSLAIRLPHQSSRRLG